MILLFNLLPIWPLDGGKLLFLIFSGLFPYRRAYHSILLFSLCLNVLLILLLLLAVPFTLSAFVLFSFLTMENRKSWKERYYVFIRFLLRRYQGEASIKRVHSIEVSCHSFLMDVFNHFRRDRKHTIMLPSLETIVRPWTKWIVCTVISTNVTIKNQLGKLSAMYHNDLSAFVDRVIHVMILSIRYSS